jgi:hypothetical protein
MSGALQAVFQNQRSFGEPLPTVIGQAYGGGFYAGQIAVGGGGTATHYLIVSPKASGEAAKQWKNVISNTPGAGSLIDGPQNTADMVDDGNSTVYPAAHFCNDLVIGGYTDWYMPAKNELEVCYYFLKNVTANNVTGFGSNANAVSPEPISTNYTTSSPAQTSATAFKEGNSEAFINGTYWTSSDGGPSYPGTDECWYQSWFDGDPGKQALYGKTAGFNVRAVRRVAV